MIHEALAAGNGADEATRFDPPAPRKGRIFRTDAPTPPAFQEDFTPGGVDGRRPFGDSVRMTEKREILIRVVDCGSRKVPDIVRILAMAGARVESVPLDLADAALSGADAVVVSGGPALFTDPDTGPALGDRFRFLDALAVPVLGICLGHQALAVRAGGRVYRGEPRREMEEIEVLEEHPLLAGLPGPLHVRQDHTEGVDAPPGYRIIARSAHYPNEAMVSVTGLRFGVQFHPEVSGTAGERLLGNFVDIARAAPGIEP